MSTQYPHRKRRRKCITSVTEDLSLSQFPHYEDDLINSVIALAEAKRQISELHRLLSKTLLENVMLKELVAYYKR